MSHSDTHSGKDGHIYSLSQVCKLHIAVLSVLMLASISEVLLSVQIHVNSIG